MKRIDWAGKTKGKLYISGVSRYRIIKSSGDRQTLWACHCSCGNFIERPSSQLTKITSCGCGRVELITTHGMSRSKEFRTWLGMRNRCLNSSDKRYPDYGGRGISICERWVSSFENFYSDMGPRPRGTSIDRIDNDGNYEPKNCRWATQDEQRRNKRSNRYLTHNGVTMQMFEWARHIGISPHALAKRLNSGRWSAAEALTTPRKEAYVRYSQRSSK